MDVPSIFSSHSASEDAQPSTKSWKIKGQSAAPQQRCHNRTLKRKVHNRLFFDLLRAKSLVEKLSGPLLQPEVRAVHLAILIHAAYSCSSHSFHRIIPPLSTVSRSAFRSRLVYMLKILFDRDTNKCFDKDMTEYLDKYHNKSINKYKAKLINKHENKRIQKYKLLQNQVHQELHPSTLTSGAALASLPCHPSTAQTPPPRSSHAGIQNCFKFLLSFFVQHLTPWGNQCKILQEKLNWYFCR